MSLIRFMLKLAYHGGDSEVPLVHLLSQPVDLPACVAEDNSLNGKEENV